MDPTRSNLDSMSNAVVTTTSFLVDSILNQRQTVDVFENRLSNSGPPMEPTYVPPHGFGGYQPSAPPYLYGSERRMPKPWDRHDEVGLGGDAAGTTSPIGPRCRLSVGEYQAGRRDDMMTFGDLKNNPRVEVDPGLSCMVAEAERKAVLTAEPHSKSFVFLK
jgi:hypothetical protein